MNKIPWTKLRTEKHEDGGKTVYWIRKGKTGHIESRTRPIPHANGRGSWLHTTYHAILLDRTEKQFHLLTLAKSYMEAINP